MSHLATQRSHARHGGQSLTATAARLTSPESDKNVAARLHMDIMGRTPQPPVGEPQLELAGWQASDGGVRLRSAHGVERTLHEVDWMSGAVAEVVWEILRRPHHRQRWTEWSRAGAAKRTRQADELDGAQTSIAWVLDNYRYEQVRDEWEVNNSSPSSRAAVQRFFRTGARPFGQPDDGLAIESHTRSTVLIDLVRAFEMNEDETAMVRAALFANHQSGAWHMGASHHTWEVARSDGDLRDTVQLSRQVIGGTADFKPAGPERPTAADIAPLRRRLDIRADALELCLRHDLDVEVETLVGYLLAYPLKESVTRRILSGEVTGAGQFGDDEIATTFGDESALYIGMVLGVDLPSRAAVMERCIARLTRWASTKPDGLLLAKRSTGDGERWLERYDFRPIGDQGGIWMRDPSAPPSRRRRRRLAQVPVESQA